jgi:peptidyl-prolyl cis-trans isomerase D
MITFMRRYRRTLQIGLLLVIAAFIASLFVFGSMGPDGGAETQVASVNGEPISVDRYQRRYQNWQRFYAQMMRERFSPELAEQMGLPQQVVEDLIQEELTVQRARAEGLEVTDEELTAHIVGVPAFQEGGRFTLRRYEERLTTMGYTKPAFEAEQRRVLTRMKIQQAVRDGVRVADAEIEQLWVAQRQEVRAAWALVELGPLMREATATDEELATYVKDHGTQFRQPERRRIQYVAFPPAAYKPTVSDADVEKYYAEHAAEFTEPRQVRAAHILVRVAETGGSDAEDQARAKIADAIRRVKAGEDFAKVAQAVSQDPGSASRGGELGLVKAGELVPDFEKALFALKKGEVSAEPVRTPFGFHAIKALEIREGGKRPLSDVAKVIRERLTSEAADRMARTRAEEVRAQLLGASDFMATARSQGLSPLETTIARRERALSTAADPMEEAAFQVTRGGVSTPVRTPAGWVVLKQVEALPAGVPPLAEIKDQVAAAVKLQKAETVAMERGRQLLAEARTSDLAQAARKVGATYVESARFSRAKPAERLPGDAMLAALRTPEGGLTDPVKATQGVYVLRTIERVPPDMSALAGEKDKLAAELLARKQGLAWESWILAARAKAKIEISSRPPPSRRG